MDVRDFHQACIILRWDAVDGEFARTSSGQQDSEGFTRGFARIHDDPIRTGSDVALSRLMTSVFLDAFLDPAAGRITA